MATQAWAVLLGAYLLGSIPSAYLVGRLVGGLDVREVGDGNLGAKNTYHVLGLLPGLVVAVADVGKGFLAAAMARQFDLPEQTAYLAGACAVLGHDFPVLLRFRGGQGMAAMVGVFAVLFPAQLAISLLILATALLISHNWDLSCTIGFASLPLLLLYSGAPSGQVLYPVAMLPAIGLRKLMVLRRSRRVAA
jgi:glycerol-3-phosphate acyltransferase PlsY